LLIVPDASAVDQEPRVYQVFVLTGAYGMSVGQVDTPTISLGAVGFGMYTVLLVKNYSQLLAVVIDCK